MAAKKKSRMSEWFDAPREEIAKKTTQAAKGYLAHKTEVLSSQFSHPEYMEEAELRAEQIKGIQHLKNMDEES
jgi:hypothetical protein